MIFRGRAERRGAARESGRSDHKAGRVPLRVLIVEDSENDALLLLRELKRGGYEPSHERVYTREAMEEALDRGTDWEVVVSDYYMPGFRAPDALALLREKGSDVPFVIVSGKVGEELAVEAMKAGAYDYIMKDSMTRLCAAVERGIEEAEVRRERTRAEEKYRSIFENAVDGIFQTTADGRPLTINPAMARILGYSSPEEFLAGVDNIAEQVYVDPGCRAEFGRLMRERGFVSGFEAEMYRKDGSTIWSSMAARIVRDVGGEPSVYEGILEDITERKRAEEKLRESEERTRTVLANAPVVLFALDSEGVYTLAEGKGMEAMGHRPGQAVGRSILDEYRDEPESLAHIRRALDGEEFTSVDELAGLGLVFEVRWSPVRDGSGAVAGVIGVATDITERKRAEEGLRRSLERLVALHEAGQLLGSTLEPEEIGARLLEIMRRISGLTAAVILMCKAGHLETWREIGLADLGPERRFAPGAREARRVALEKEETSVFAPNPSDGGPPVGLCLPLRTRDRVMGVLEVYGPHALAEEDNVAMLESLTNGAASALENARLYGELQEREKRLQELVGKILVAQEEERRRVAYEVHDGLAQVAAAAHQHLQAFAQFHPPQSEEGREDLARVSKLVRQNVGEARRIIADLRPTALDEFGLKSAIRLHLDTLRAEGWSIDYEASLGGERLPAAMETAIFRVVQEALNNVGKHAGTRRVEVSLERLPLGDPAGAAAPGDKRTIRLSVRDHGRGFEPGSPPDGAPGQQVGLAGMRERITLLGGDFRIASRPGEGTLVVAEVPLPKDDG